VAAQKDIRRRAAHQHKVKRARGGLIDARQHRSSSCFCPSRSGRSSCESCRAFDADVHLAIEATELHASDAFAHQQVSTTGTVALVAATTKFIGGVRGLPLKNPATAFAREQQ
jgi:hypothetical protein